MSAPGEFSSGKLHINFFDCVSMGVHLMEFFGPCRERGS